MLLFAKNVVHFGFLTNEVECERGKQDFSNNVSLYLKAKNGRKMIFKKILYN